MVKPDDQERLTVFLTEGEYCIGKKERNLHNERDYFVLQKTYSYFILGSGQAI